MCIIFYAHHCCASVVFEDKMRGNEMSINEMVARQERFAGVASLNSFAGLLWD